MATDFMSRAIFTFLEACLVLCCAERPEVKLAVMTFPSLNTVGIIIISVITGGTYCAHMCMCMCMFTMDCKEDHERGTEYLLKSHFVAFQKKMHTVTQEAAGCITGYANVTLVLTQG